MKFCVGWASPHRLLESHPTRGAWIEMLLHLGLVHMLVVAPHTGCVD